MIGIPKTSGIHLHRLHVRSSRQRTLFHASLTASMHKRKCLARYGVISKIKDVRFHNNDESGLLRLLCEYLTYVKNNKGVRIEALWKDEKEAREMLGSILIQICMRLHLAHTSRSEKTLARARVYLDYFHKYSDLSTDEICERAYVHLCSGCMLM